MYCTVIVHNYFHCYFIRINESIYFVRILSLGVAHQSNGDVYAGQYENGKRTGLCIYSYADDGSTYYGSVRGGIRRGRGLMQYANGMCRKLELLQCLSDSDMIIRRIILFKVVTFA